MDKSPPPYSVTKPVQMTPTRWSFSQGGVLKIANANGQWWPARKLKDGQIGRVPGNYFRLDGATDSAKKMQPPGVTRQKRDKTPSVPPSSIPPHWVWTKYPDRVRALFDCNASPEESNEISFPKSEILEVADISGKWWPARKAGGDIGIVPSNYLLCRTQEEMAALVTRSNR